MFAFENLFVHKESLELVDLVYRVIRSWPRAEIFGLGDQFKRAAISIALNIAEGSSRTKKDFRHFLDLARGSCYECVAIIAIAKRLGYLSEQEYKNLYEKLEKMSRMLSGLKASLR